MEDFATRHIRECEQRNVLQKENIVCGDHVSYQLVKPSSNPKVKYQESGLVVGRDVRRNALCRSDRLKRSANEMKVIAANVDQLFIVVAPLPHVPLESIDHLLAAGEIYGMKPVIVLNKSDLPGAEKIEADLTFYREMLGYEMIRVSSQSGEGLDGVRRALRQGNVSIFVGQSGVGKSSLVNLLLEESGDEQQLEVGELTKKGGFGTHTTSTAKLIRVSTSLEEAAEDEMAEGDDAMVIDSPGIRDLHLAHMDRSELIRGFPDLEAASNFCHFKNCDHSESQAGCAIQEAIASGTILPSRLRSFASLSEV